MPQIAQIGEIYSSQLFWLAITFGLIFFGIGLGMLPKIQSTVDQRDARIAADLAEAERARESADVLEEDYRKAMERARSAAAQAVTEAKAQSGRLTEERLAEADSSLDARFEDAKARIAKAREAALADLRDVAADATRQMVARVARIDVAEAQARTAVEKELSDG